MIVRIGTPSAGGTDASVAYLLDVAAGVVRSCSCPAGAHGDPVCKHAARFYLDAGSLDPEPPTPAAPPAYRCAAWQDTSGVEVESTMFPGRVYDAACQACREVYAPVAIGSRKHERRAA